MGNSAYWREKHPDPRAGRNNDVESDKGKYETESEAALQTGEKIIDVTEGKIYLLDGFDGEILLVDNLKQLGYTLVNRRGTLNYYKLSIKSSE